MSPVETASAWTSPGVSPLSSTQSRQRGTRWDQQGQATKFNTPMSRPSQEQAYRVRSHKEGPAATAQGKDHQDGCGNPEMTGQNGFGSEVRW